VIVVEMLAILIWGLFAGGVAWLLRGDLASNVSLLHDLSAGGLCCIVRSQGVLTRQVVGAAGQMALASSVNARASRLPTGSSAAIS
jgi:hypothetical protein